MDPSNIIISFTEEQLPHDANITEAVIKSVDELALGSPRCLQLPKTPWRPGIPRGGRAQPRRFIGSTRGAALDHGLQEGRM